VPVIGTDIHISKFHDTAFYTIPSLISIQFQRCRIIKKSPRRPERITVSKAPKRVGAGSEPVGEYVLKFLWGDQPFQAPAIQTQVGVCHWSANYAQDQSETE